MKDTDLCWCGSGNVYATCHKSMDEKLKKLRARGEKVPPRKLIKTPAQIAGIREAGRINSMVLDKVASVIKAGMSTLELNDIVDSYTRELGGIPAPLNYEGFPKSVCISVNEQVCHGIPDANTILEEGDIVNVDCTTIYNGYYGDASRMFLIGECDADAKRLVEVTKEAVDIAIKNIKPYCHLGDVGYYIGNHAHKNGYTVVREIGGHGVGLEMHEDPYVCHVGNLHEGMVLVPGMVITIEPMINEGKRDVYQDADNGWTVYSMDGSWSAQVEHMILITDTGCEILSK